MIMSAEIEDFVKARAVFMKVMSRLDSFQTTVLERNSFKSTTVAASLWPLLNGPLRATKSSSSNFADIDLPFSSTAITSAYNEVSSTLDTFQSCPDLSALSSDGSVLLLSAGLQYLR